MSLRRITRDRGLSPEEAAQYREIRERKASFWITTSTAKLVGIDIDNASNKVELKRLVLSRLPGKVENTAA